MRRRPDEDDREQHEGLERDRARHGGLADHRREGARGAADDDVLRRRALQPHRVDDDVEEDREGEEARGEPVGDEPEHQHRAGRKRQAEGERLVRRDPPAGIGRLRVRVIRASISASHHMLRQPEAPAPTAIIEERGEGDHRVHGGMRHHHADERREHDERHHPRLQERDVVGDLAVRGRVRSERVRSRRGRSGCSMQRPWSKWLTRAA